MEGRKLVQKHADRIDTICSTSVPTSLAGNPSERGLAGVRLSFKGLNGVGSALPSNDPERVSVCRCTGELLGSLLLDLLKALRSPIVYCQCMFYRQH